MLGGVVSGMRSQWRCPTSSPFCPYGQRGNSLQFSMVWKQQDAVADWSVLLVSQDEWWWKAGCYLLARPWKHEGGVPVLPVSVWVWAQHLGGAGLCSISRTTQHWGTAWLRAGGWVAPHLAPLFLRLQGIALFELRLPVCTFFLLSSFFLGPL